MFVGDLVIDDFVYDFVCVVVDVVYVGVEEGLGDGVFGDVVVVVV